MGKVSVDRIMHGGAINIDVGKKCGGTTYLQPTGVYDRDPHLCSPPVFPRTGACLGVLCTHQPCPSVLLVLLPRRLVTSSAES